MPERPRQPAFVRHSGRITLCLLVFLVFLCNAVGLFDVRLGTTGDIAFRSTMFAHFINEGRVPAVVYTAQFAVLVAEGLALSLLLPLLDPIKASGLAFAAMVPVVYLGLTPAKPSILLPMEYSLVAILVLFGTNVLADYFVETRKKQQLIAVFGRYVPAQIVQRISDEPKDFTMAGESREMTVLFCDIKSFTSIAERLDPRQLVQMLNTLFDPLTRVMHKHLGTIDKYMGDAVMAFWGAPAHDPRHAEHAVRAAIEMQQVLCGLRRVFARNGWPEISMGIGISTGVMSVGNMGSRYRVAYTVVGDAVNLAARLESLTRDLDAEIIVNEATMNAVPQVLFRELGTVKVKGKQIVTRAYEPICLAADATPEIVARLQEHARALEAYYQRRWDRAVTLFGKLWEKDPEDRIYDIYLKNIAKFTEGPRPADWTGELDPAP